jgi:glucose-1-phosphate cytidylyltransferase
MKTVIFAGGLGTRFPEEAQTKPKPMIEIGGKPILLHIMNLYAHYNYKDFIVALGYKGEIIKQYFSQLPHKWNIHLIDTGQKTMTGGRIKRLQKFIGNETFMLTYGDGVANINLDELLAFHRNHGKLVTITAVRPPARFGALSLDGERVKSFKEKSQTDEGWINGGFFVIEPSFLELIDGDNIHLEKGPLEQAALKGELFAYKHTGFWQCMDNVRDKIYLEDLWNKKKAPWKSWS